MSELRTLQDTLLVLAAIAVGVACTLVFLLYRRVKYEESQTNQSPFNNMTEISMLFQTMRDLVREQKTLARDFNRSLDVKVEVVREAVRQVIAGHEQLTRMQKTFKDRLEKAGAPLEDTDFDEDLPPLQAIAMPEEADIIDSWETYGPENAAADAAADAEPPAPAIEPDHDPAAAREALSALLNLDHAPAPPPDTTEKTPRPAPANGAATLHKTVFRYHDAGMNVSEIAKELGLGKGEIRLMLNLRDEDRSGQALKEH